MQILLERRSPLAAYLLGQVKVSNWLLWPKLLRLFPLRRLDPDRRVGVFH